VTAHDAIRVWGSGHLQVLVRRWEQGLKNSQPRVRVESRPTGSDVAMAGLYTGLADLAVLGRECTAVESKAFEWIFRYPPAHVQLTTGSLDRPGRSPALVAFVHRDNPLSQLTLVQLDAIFGHECLSGAQQNIRTWGDLGLQGEWAGRFIHLYAHDAESGTGRFFRRVVLRDSCKMNWEHLTEFNTPDAGDRILAAVAGDRFGLAMTGASGESVPQVKALALARGSGDEAVAATRESLISCRYPLTRAVYGYFNRRPDGPLEAGLGGFLRHALSREGQQPVAGSDYLPLSPDTAREQLRKLE
jgi:phosphate transport system substrate-binding protein